jgi:hypothetical protein
MASWDAGESSEAARLLEEAVGDLTSANGEYHPDTIAAKGDLAAVLFALGHDEAARWIEREAFESARVHLGKQHTVTSVLAWNRALNCERHGDFESARRVMIDELPWLLAEDPASLHDDQSIVRGLLAARWNWNAASVCTSAAC